MDPNIDLLEKSQRLRYEAFSVFASGINKAGDLETIAGCITAQIKFMVDAFIIRVFYQYDHYQLFFEIFRGNCHIRENNQDAFNGFELELLKIGIPISLSKEQLQANKEIADSIFNHEKTLSFYALPITIHPTHQLSIAVANKEPSFYTEVDFRFLRLMGDLLSSKLSQLLLLKSVESKNAELGYANESLSSANEELQTLIEKIGHLNQTLEKKVEERTAELKKANEELTTIFYRTSHDFRRPLTSILGLTQLAELTTDNKDTLDLFSHCRSVVSEMDAMLTKLSILSSSDPTHILLEPIDFKVICQELQEKFSNKLQQRAIQFSYSISLSQPFYSDIKVMKAVMENVVENAIYFHGINPYVQLDIRETEFGIEIQIIDNGQGIEDSKVEKIFDMYYRANEQSKGNGLGLYVVKKLVKLLQGEVGVESKKFVGSTFTLALPYLKE